jgi:hypothetical protein
MLGRFGGGKGFLSLSELVLERTALLLKCDLGKTLGILSPTSGGGRGVGRGGSRGGDSVPLDCGRRLACAPSLLLSEVRVNMAEGRWLTVSQSRGRQRTLQSPSKGRRRWRWTDA